MVDAERREANVLLVFDTSGSMLATDVVPSRLQAAQLAGKTFVDKVPEGFRVGVISFGSTAQQLSEPTTDKAQVKATIDALQVKGATAMGDALKLAVNSARVPVPDGLGGAKRLPAAIVLLGDGASTRGDDPIDVVQDTKKFKIPVYTVALGTQGGVLTHTDPNTGRDQQRAGPAGPADAAGHRARHRRAVLRHRRRAPARGRLREHRHAADQDQGEAAGDVGLRGRARWCCSSRARASVWRGWVAGHEAGDDSRCALASLGAIAQRAILPVGGDSVRLVEPPDRSPSKPGPGPVPPAVLRSLDLAVMKKIDSLVPGEHLTPQTGQGTELAMIRPYFPGDDVRHIDWNATARLQEPLRAGARG